MSVWNPEDCFTSYATLTRSCKHLYAGYLEGTDEARAAEFARLKRTPCPECEKKAAEYVGPTVGAA